MDATYTAENSKRKEGSTNEKRRIPLRSNKIQTIEPIFKPKINKREGIACSKPLHEEVEKRVRGVQTKKDVYNRVQTKYTND